MNGYTKNVTYSITFTGFMLGLVLLFQYLEQFMPFGNTYIKINITMIFIMATFYVVGWEWAITLLILRFVIGPAVSPLGYSSLGIWSQAVLLICGALFMAIFTSIFYLLSKKMNKRYALIYTSVISVILMSVIASMLNAVLFSPVYWYLLNYIKTPSIAASKVAYSFVKDVAFFGVPNYWAGMLTAFGAGNLIKYSIVVIAFIPLWKVIEEFTKSKA